MTFTVFCLFGAACGLLSAWLSPPLRLHWLLWRTAASSLLFPCLIYFGQTAHMTFTVFCLFGAACGLLSAWLCLPLRLHWFLWWTAASSLFFPFLLYSAQTAHTGTHETLIWMPLAVIPAAVCGLAAAVLMRLLLRLLLRRKNGKP